MKPILRNILAVIAGCLVGGVVNMGIVMIGPSLIPPPEGVDMTTMEGLKASMHLLQPKNYIMPFLAHALGTLVGAYVAARIAIFKKMELGLLVGLFTLVGGVMNILMLPESPLWFNVLDLAGAYIPMAYIGASIAKGKQGNI